MTRFGMLGAFIIFAGHPLISESTSCLLSNKTAQIVDSCPESLIEMTKRAKVKNCEEQSRTHNCSGAEPYEYHCLINELEDAFVEVCAEKYFINIGTCAEYNIIGGVIQPHNRLNCTNGNPPCPIRYKSTDSYRYKYCYDTVRKNTYISTQELTTIENNTSSTQLATNGRYKSSTEFTTVESIHSTRQDNATTNGDNENSTSHVAAIVVLPIIIIMLLLAFIFKYRTKIPYIRDCFQGQKKGNDQRDVEDPTDRVENAGSALLHEGGNNSRNTNAGSALLHEGGNNSRNRNIEEPRDPVENAGSALLHEGGNNSRNRKKQICKEKYEDEIQSAQLLLELISMKEINISEKITEKKDRAKTFMAANENMITSYVETTMLEACRVSLDENGIAILIGRQGCGKTLTAVHIMHSYQYKDWTNIMFTSWEDLLTIEVADKSLVYIDNILDGFIYQDIVQKWFNSLCYFYFEQFKRGKDVHILISCKRNVIEEALEYIRADAVQDTILLKAESFPLTVEEKSKILKAQFDIAKDLKNMKNPNPNSNFTFLKSKESDIGFPMCAHMYAFETNSCDKTAAIFECPRTYVIHHIRNEIEKDKTKGVMTLFLILLFDANTMRGLDLKYGGKCRDYLEEMVSKDFVDKMTLHFENLQERANDLKDTILVKVSSMFEFKHQIYKEGVVDYFCRKNATCFYSIRYFPLDILRSCEFSDATTDIWMHINRRLMNELKNIRNITMNEYGVNERKVAEVFSCKIFECRAFEKEFSKEFEKALKEDYTLHEFLFNRKLHLSFWIGRYNLNALLKTVMDLVDQFSDYQLCQALLGNCCMRDKKYSVHLTSHMDLDTLQKRVFDFKDSHGESIQDLILQSDKLDCDTQKLFAKVLPHQSNKHDL